MKLKFLTVLSIILLGALLRFYKIDWAQGLFSHPDEYHIVASVSQLSFPSQMHPHFFSYGTVVIYLIYFTQEIIKYVFSIFNLFFIGRFYSALFSTLTIFIVYKICRSFMQTSFSYLAAFLVAITPGLIQQAHFATPESALTFFLFGFLLFIIKFLKQHEILFLVLASLSLGFAMGVKITSIVFLLPLTTAILISSYPKNLSFRTPGLFIKRTLGILLKFTKLIVVSTVLVTLTFAIVAPYVFLDFPTFLRNLEYEGGLAIGKFPVFYTRQFIETFPILFQAEKILPYALGPSLFLFSSIGLIFIIINFIKKPKVELAILVIAFLSLFISNAFLFAKWTRFIAPTFPFFAIFSVFLLQVLGKKMQFMLYALIGILAGTTALWTMTFFSIYTNPDIRITASTWLESHVQKGSSFLVEGGNTVDLPLSGNFQRTSLDFYSLENDSFTREKIIDALYSSDYFLIQSRRVFYNHQRLPSLYPKTARFYDLVFDGKMGFTQIQEFHSYPRLKIGNWILEIPDETAEETWSVFDHPVIRVFMKTKQLAKEDYAKFLE